MDRRSVMPELLPTKYPHGPEPPVFFFGGWAPNGGFAYWNFANATDAIPLQSGRLLPGVPAGGIQSKEGVAAFREPG